MAVILVIHLMLAVAMITVILIQRTAQDGGGLMGGGSTMGGLFTARGSANLLTRTTAALAVAFICTSLLLAWMAGHNRSATVDLSPAMPVTAPAQPVEKTAPQEQAPSVPLGQ